MEFPLQGPGILVTHDISSDKISCTINEVSTDADDSSRPSSTELGNPLQNLLCEGSLSLSQEAETYL